jgi:7-cyano-7-deazaguanine synthase
MNDGSRCLPAGPAARSGGDIAILISGGLDSAILLSELLAAHGSVFPLYVQQGLYWETAEQHWLRQLLEACRCAALRPLQILDMPVRDLYGAHWSITGHDVPDASSADEAVFLPGRNILLLAKAMLWCHLHNVARLALAPLESNPFPDATPAFFAAFQSAVNEGVGGGVEVARPYAGLKKIEVMRRGQGLPLHLTFSCIHPVSGRHCGRCNKCAERRHAFAEAGMPDPTEYASSLPVAARKGGSL